LEARPNDPNSPGFDYGQNLPAPKIIVLRENDEQRAWQTALMAAVQDGDWQVCVANLILIPQRSLRSEVEGKSMFDGASFLAEILTNTAHGKLVAALVPRTILVDQRSSAFR